jgi:hypothetical protein
VRVSHRVAITAAFVALTAAAPAQAAGTASLIEAAVDDLEVTRN